jgi:DNA-binding transcriptional MerR regulator
MALTIGQVATAADVNIQTIRYYERRGLFPTAKRTPAGYRQYADDAVARLRFIKHAQDLGFSLNEIQELGPTGTRRRTRGSPWTKRPSISPCGNFSSTSA